jgi:fucose permease
MITPVQTSSTGNRSTSWFRTADGNNYAFIFLLVSSLFLLWGVCNGMIDVLNKHFQDSLHITKAQSAFVQFANYMGYFFMAIPSGLLAIRFGYKGAIIIGLTFVALGALWFIPATHIGTYWAFLLGLFILAAGLTCLETVCNPYATVLGPPESGAARINLAQSANGVGWMIGPVLGGYFVLSSTGEAMTSNADLYKPYLIVGGVVAVIAAIFIISKVPDLHNFDESKLDATNGRAAVKPLWKRWHFVLAVAAQFFYVAAQTGIFSFFVNYIATETPILHQQSANSLQKYADVLHSLYLVPSSRMTYSAALFSAGDLPNVPGLVGKLQNDSDPRSEAVSHVIWSRLPADFSQTAEPDQKAALLKAMNQMLQTNLLFGAAQSSLSEQQRNLFASNPAAEAEVRANRALLESVYPADLVARSKHLDGPEFRVTDVGASVLLGFGGFALFLLGRITGSFALRVVRPHLMLALYSAANILMMILAMNAWGWWSVAGLFLSFFFMSIMYPTIFSLGIHGLGEKTKIASSFIVQSIVGGAIMPMFMGWLADHWGMRVGFLMPLLCFAFVAFYGASWLKLESKDRVV